MMTNPQRGMRDTLPALWLRWVAVFCMALIGVASTAQVCHSHEDAFRTSVQKAGASRSEKADAGQLAKSGIPGDRDSKTDSSVRCPLCIAMHAALPVASSLPQVELLQIASQPAVFERANRLFSWRFEMASRPPPVERLHA